MQSAKFAYFVHISLFIWFMKIILAYTTYFFHAYFLILASCRLHIWGGAHFGFPFLVSFSLFFFGQFGPFSAIFESFESMTEF